MKKLILGTLVVFMAVSCNQKKIERLEYEKDSILQVKDQIVQERDAFLEIISEVQSNFRTIKEIELGIIDQTHGTEGINNMSKARIREDFQFITDKIQESKDRIEQLEVDLQRSQGQTAHYRGLLANLQKDLEVRVQEIAELKSQLEEKNLKIEALSDQVTSLNQSKDSLSSLTTKQIAAIKAQDEELNTGWYIVGKKSDLKAKGLKEGDLKTSKINKGNFKKVDIREFSELDLGSKKAKLYTSHPASSYSLTKKSASDKNLVFKINDYKSFWSNSKTLIIEVN